MELHRFTKPAVSVFVAVLALWIGSSVFSYLTYRAEPEVKVLGVEQGEYYKGIVACSLRGSNGYKVASVSVKLDGKDFFVDGARYVKSKRFDLPFELATNELSDGKHVLQIDSVDSSYHANKKSEQIEFHVDNMPLKAELLQVDYQINQGRTFQPKIQMNKPVKTAVVKVLSKEHLCYPDAENSTAYESFIPVDCEQCHGEFMFSVEVKDRVGNLINLAGGLKIKKVNFPRQKGFYVAPEKLNDEREVSMNDRILDEALSKWLEKSPKKKLWGGAFEVPTIVKRISTPYGEIRITPEKGRYLHRAIDIVNDPQSVVWASQNGRVIIKDRYLMTGNTIVLDHGLGVFTKYFHLDDFADVEVGELVKKGAPLGRLGMTGYAHGYHLHWELSINGVSVDPVEWTKKVY